MDDEWVFSDEEDEAFLEEWRAVDRAAAHYLEERVPGLTDPVSDDESRWLDALVESFDPTDKPDVNVEDPEGTRQVLSTAFVVLTPTWQDLGVLDEDECFTERGVWDLPRALHRSWSH